MKFWICLLLLVFTLPALGDGTWTDLNSEKYKLSVKFPYAHVEETPIPSGFAWIASQDGRGVASVSVLEIPTPDAGRMRELEGGAVAYLKLIKVTETARRAIEFKGFRGFEILGTRALSNGHNYPAKVRTLINKDRVVYASIIEFHNDRSQADEFLESLVPAL